MLKLTDHVFRCLSNNDLSKCCIDPRMGERRPNEKHLKQNAYQFQCRGYFSPNHKDAEIFVTHLNPILLVFIG